MIKRFVDKFFLFVLFISVFFLVAPSPISAEDTEDQSADNVADESSLYTIMPMFMTNAPSAVNYNDLLTTMIVDQGYEAHCSGAQWVISPKEWGDIEKFFSQSTPPIEGYYKGASNIFGGTNPYIVDFTTARIPVFRGMEDKTTTMKNSSIEGMFGANIQTLEKNYVLNASGVSQNLLNSYQQCMAKAQNLASIGKICAETDGECTVNKKYTIQVDNQSITFKMKDILDWFSQIRPGLSGTELYQQVCADITGGGSYDPTTYNQQHADAPNVDQELIDKTQKAVEVIPIDLDTLYRLAFLVLVPRQQMEGDGDNFSFLQSNPQVNSKAHAPIFIAFKIPEFGTNKSTYVNNIDSLELAKMAIQTIEQNTKDTEDQKAKRGSDYELAKAAPQLEDPIIKCPSSYPQCERSNKNALLNVLVDMINGAAPNCQNTTLRIQEDTTVDEVFNQEDVNWEKAGDLFTPANKDIKANTYVHNVNEDVVNRLDVSSQNLFDWEAIVNPQENFGEPVVVNAYIVLPVGENIKDVNKSLAIFWNEEQFFNMVKTNVIEDMKNTDGTSKQGSIPKFYTIKGANVGIDASDIRSYKDSCEPKATLVEDENGKMVSEYVCTNYKFGVGLQESKDSSLDVSVPLVPDFGLGFMLRKIQKTIRATFDNTYDYIASCQRVEDMFLGRCSGNPTGEPTSVCNGTAYKNLKNMPSASGVPQFAQDMFASQIAPKLSDDLIEAYEYAEQETGIPCEVVAGIHWVEAGLNANQSVFDGGSLHGTLKEDAKAAMEHLISKWPGTFDKNNMEYQDLVAAIAGYNGYGNLNCSAETRWLNGGKCPAQFDFEDHPHALGYIDDRHSDMDLIYCLDFVEFNCNTSPTSSALAELRSSLDAKQATYGFSDATKEGLITDAANYCYANSSVCQNLSSGGKFPRFERPGSVTTAVLLNAAE